MNSKGLLYAALLVLVILGIVILAVEHLKVH